MSGWRCSAVNYEDPEFVDAELVPQVDGASLDADRIRAGSQALAVFARQLTARVLRIHAEGPLCPSELEERVGWAPGTSLRTAAATLRRLGALARVEPAGRGRATATELTAAGRELLLVAEALEHWLLSSPGGPIPLDSTAGCGTVKVLTAGWDSTIAMALAERPLSLTELNDAIANTNYPALKRRISKLRSTSLVAPIGRGKGTTYVATDWLRRAIAPIVVAGRWERKHDPGFERVTRGEAEAAFMLTLPLVGKLPGGASGTCALTVLAAEEGDGPPAEIGGVTVEVEDGQIAAFSPSTTLAPTTWALGTAGAWFEAVIAGCPEALDTRGSQPELPLEIVEALHTALLMPEGGPPAELS
jgi:DNA-binding HxlR family transcriptional regulator